MRFVTYFMKSINKSGFEQAFELYLDYMQKEKLEPEFTQEQYDNTEFDDIEDTTLSHVIYHASLNNFPLDDYMV